MHIASVRAASLVQQSSYSSAPDRAAVYCDERVCLSVCVCVCLSVRDHIFRTTRPIFANFCECYPRPWLGPPPASNTL